MASCGFMYFYGVSFLLSPFSQRHHDGIMTASCENYWLPLLYLYRLCSIFYIIVRFNIYGIIKVDISYLFVLHETGVNVYLSNPFKTFGCVGILLVGPVPFSKILFEHL